MLPNDLIVVSHTTQWPRDFNVFRVATSLAVFVSSFSFRSVINTGLFAELPHDSEFWRPPQDSNLRTTAGFNAPPPTASELRDTSQRTVFALRLLLHSRANLKSSRKSFLGWCRTVDSNHTLPVKTSSPVVFPEYLFCLAVLPQWASGTNVEPATEPFRVTLLVTSQITQPQTIDSTFHYRATRS